MISLLQPRRGDISIGMPFPSRLSPVGATFVLCSDKIFKHPVVSKNRDPEVILRKMRGQLHAIGGLPLFSKKTFKASLNTSWRFLSSSAAMIRN